MKRITIKFTKEDCWIGVYWDRDRVFICLIPTLPIIILRRPIDVCKYCKQHKNLDDYCKCKTENHDSENECQFCGRCKIQ